MLKLMKILITAAVIVVVIATAVATRDWSVAGWAFASIVVGCALCTMWNLKSVNE